MKWTKPETAMFVTLFVCSIASEIVVEIGLWYAATWTPTLQLITGVCKVLVAAVFVVTIWGAYEWRHS